MTVRIKAFMGLSRSQISGDLDALTVDITTGSTEAFKLYNEGRRLQMAGEPGRATLATPAPPLVPEDLPRLGERFYRIDTGEKGTHVGLGLSLAGAIARVLGLTLSLGLREDGCLVAKVRGFQALEPATASHDVTHPRNGRWLPCPWAAAAALHKTAIPLAPPLRDIPAYLSHP